MTETVAEKEICPTCQTELPGTAVFCYACGKPVNTETPARVTGPLSDVWKRENISADTATKTAPVDLPDQSPENLESKQIQKNLEKDGLKPASAMRVKARKMPPKEVEVRWEEPETGPNLWFLCGALFLIIFALIIYFVAMYLR